MDGPGAPVFLQQQLVVPRVSLDQKTSPAQVSLHVQRVGAGFTVQSAAFDERAARLTNMTRLGDVSRTWRTRVGGGGRCRQIEGVTIKPL